MPAGSVILRLRHDHRAVLERTDELSRIVRRATSTTPAARGAAVRTADALVSFFARRLPAHFALEEGALPAPAASPPDEHAALGAELEALIATREAWRRGSAGDAELLDGATSFAHRLRRHIEEEEQRFTAWLTG